jgi:stalled ribosome rescue protein Dom34
MTINAGLWIDHHKAVVVLITADDEDMLQIMSNRDTPARSLGGKRVKQTYTSSDFVAEDKRERKAMSHLNKFYDDVVACLLDADAILVLGPGEAKGEFIKRLEGTKLKGRIAHVGTVDKMTDRQIAAHVRRHFVLMPQKTNGELHKSRESGRFHQPLASSPLLGDSG